MKHDSIFNKKHMEGDAYIYSILILQEEAAYTFVNSSITWSNNGDILWRISTDDSRLWLCKNSHLAVIASVWLQIRAS